MTFVIISDGIDLSVGSTVALSSILTGEMLVNAHLPAVVVGLAERGLNTRKELDGADVGPLVEVLADPQAEGPTS